MKNWLWVNGNHLISAAKATVGLFVGYEALDKVLDKFPQIGRSVAPVRFGIAENDRKTDFVETGAKRLRAYYKGYGDSLCAAYKLTYEELVTFGDFKLKGRPALDLKQFKTSVRIVSWKVDPRIKRHKDEAFALFAKIGKLRRMPDGSIMNENNLRLSSWDAGGMILGLAPAKYAEMVGTNLTMDWASTHLSDRSNPSLSSSSTATLRNDLEYASDGLLTPLHESSLANVIGVACMLYVADGQALVRVRSDDTAIMWGEGKLHCSASGAATFPEDIDALADGERFEQYLYAEMKREIKEETDLGDADYQLKLVAFARELVRGGHPQFFFVAYTKLDRQAIEARLLQAKDSWEFRSSDGLDSRLRAVQSNPAAYLDTYSDAFTYEGFATFMLTRMYHDQCEVAA